MQNQFWSAVLIFMVVVDEVKEAHCANPEMSVGQWFSEQMGFHWGVKAVVQRALLKFRPLVLIWLNIVAKIPAWYHGIDLCVSVCACTVCLICCLLTPVSWYSHNQNIFVAVAVASYKLETLDLQSCFFCRWWNKLIMSVLMNNISECKRKPKRCAESKLPCFLTDQTWQVWLGLVSMILPTR